MSCPDLAALAAAHADPGAHRAVVEHVHAGCASCAAHWRRLDVFEAVAALGPLPQVPAHLHAAALAIPEQQTAGVAGRLLSLVGRLVFDSAGGRLVPGLRDAGAGRRHLLYEAGPYEIDLALVEPATLVGQVMGPEDADLRDAVVLLSGEGRTFDAAVLEHGDFHLDGVAPGRYALQIGSDDLDLVLPDVDLTSPGSA
ncbi:MAG: hypothetical protein H6825_13755 [Planctomycetes bacterium]|nr:hypothetical protein [Planctomycetota bacterium]